MIQDPFFKHGGLHKFGKFSIIEDPFTNQDPTLVWPGAPFVASLLLVAMPGAPSSLCPFYRTLIKL